MWHGRKVRSASSALLGVAMSLSFATVAPAAIAHSAAPSVGGPSVTVTPSTNLTEGQQVTVAATGLSHSAAAVVAECTVGTVDPNTCDTTNFLDVVTNPAGAFSTPYVVHLGFISGAGDIVDCRTTSCEMAVIDLGAVGSPVLSAAPLTFNPHGPTTTLKVTPSALLLDGQTVHVHGTGFTDPSGLIAVLECVNA